MMSDEMEQMDLAPILDALHRDIARLALQTEIPARLMVLDQHDVLELSDNTDQSQGEQMTERSDSTAAAAFSAIEAIASGEWDHFLHRLRGAIEMRCRTEDYRDSLVAGEWR